MRKENIIKRLEMEGYEVVSGKFDYWQVAKIIIDDESYLLLADGLMRNGSYGVIENFKYSDVQLAIQAAKCNKYHDNCSQIRSMADYFHFSKPWNERQDLREDDEQ